MSPTEEKLPTEEKPPTEEDIRENLRTIGLTRLARSADLPQYLPTITHSIYADVYWAGYGDRPLVDDLPYDHVDHQYSLFVARVEFDNIMYSDEYIEDENEDSASEWHYKFLVKEGQTIQKSAHAVLTREQVEQYVEVAEKAIEKMDEIRGKEWSKKWDDGMEREVLVAYCLKVMEIGKRWPRRVAALGLGRLTLESM